MFTRPEGLSDNDFAAALDEGWGLGQATIEYAPVGFGSHHWRVGSSDERWFATVDDLEAKRRTRSEPLDQPRQRLAAALTTARALRDAGLDFVVAPVPTATQQVMHRITDRYTLAIYPQVDGRTHLYGPYPSRDERIAVVELLAALHTAPGRCRRGAFTDDFELANRDALTCALDDLATPWNTGPFAEPARRLLANHRSAVTHVLERYDRLAMAQRSRPERLVLTHGEPHPGNTITTSRGVVLIDWDTALIAPPERDLWNLIGEDPTVADDYAARTGSAVDVDATHMFKLGWDLTEIAVYIAEFRRPHTETLDTRTAWINLDGYLDPTRW